MPDWERELLAAEEMAPESVTVEASAEEAPTAEPDEVIVIEVNEVPGELSAEEVAEVIESIEVLEEPIEVIEVVEAPQEPVEVIEAVEAPVEEPVEAPAEEPVEEVPADEPPAKKTPRAKAK